MPYSLGPNITRTGLVFTYDTGDQTNSWKGEPTTNLVGSPFSVTSGYATTLSTTDNVTLNWNGQNTGGLISGNGYFAYVSAATTNGNKYTTSWYVKGGTTNSINFVWGGAHQGNRTDFNFNTSTGAITGVSLASGEIYGASYLNNGWWQVYYSSTLSSGNSYYPQITLNGTAYVGGLQIEQKAYPTPFVQGTRSTTQGLLDISGNNNTVTLTNMTYGANNAISFDGTDDYIDLGNPTAFQSLNSGTIEAIYYRVASTGTYQMIFTDAGSDMEITYSANVLQFYIGNSGISYTHAVTGQWFHVAGVWTPATKTLYLNGVQVATGGNGLTTGNRTRYVGSRGGSYAFNGRVPIVKVYNQSLSAQQVLQNYNSYKTRFNIT
jgi:hypothetical protein